MDYFGLGRLLEFVFVARRSSLNLFKGRYADENYQ